MCVLKGFATGDTDSWKEYESTNRCKLNSNELRHPADYRKFLKTSGSPKPRLSIAMVVNCSWGSLNQVPWKTKKIKILLKTIVLYFIVFTISSQLLTFLCRESKRNKFLYTFSPRTHFLLSIYNTVLPNPFISWFTSPSFFSWFASCLLILLRMTEIVDNHLEKYFW